MPDLLIKPLRAYEDRGLIRDVNHEPYAAPVWLAKELEQLKLCEIVGESSVDPVAAASGNNPEAALNLAKKGQRWIVTDAQGTQVGDFIGKREEAEKEMAKLSASTKPSSSVELVSPAAATSSDETSASTSASDAPAETVTGDSNQE